MFKNSLLVTTFLLGLICLLNVCGCTRYECVRTEQRLVQKETCYSHDKKGGCTYMVISKQLENVCVEYKKVSDDSSSVARDREAANSIKNIMDEIDSDSSKSLCGQRAASWSDIACRKWKCENPEVASFAVSVFPDWSGDGSTITGGCRVVEPGFTCFSFTRCDSAKFRKCECAE